MKRLAILAVVAPLALASCTTDDVFPAFRPEVQRLDAAMLRADYVGYTFQSEHGDTIRFEPDGTYVTEDGRRGTYEIKPRGVLALRGEKDSFHLTPAGQRLNRAELGIELTVQKRGESYVHIMNPGGQRGTYRRLAAGL